MSAQGARKYSKENLYSQNKMKMRANNNGSIIWQKIRNDYAPSAEMKPECRTHLVPKDGLVYFTPGTLDNAKEKRFVPCKYCIGE